MDVMRIGRLLDKNNGVVVGMLTSKRKILIDILVPLSGQGGVEKVINSTAKYLNSNGYHVRVVQMVYSGPYWLEPGIDFYPILVNQKVDSISDMVPLYIEYLRQTGIPDLVLACPWPYLSMVARMALDVYDKPCKVISWMHGPLHEYAKYGTGGIDCLEYADYHFVLNKKTQNILNSNLRSGAGVSLVYNPVDFSKCVFHEEYNLNAHTLLFVGRLSAEKSLDIVIKALSLTQSEWKLKVIGDGEEKANLIELGEKLGIVDSIEYLGWQANPWEHADNVTAMVLSSAFEGFPLAAVESMASGIPVIATAVDGVTELVNIGVTGFLYQGIDSSEMSGASETTEELKLSEISENTREHSAGELAMILDCMSNGILPRLNPTECKKSVERYEMDPALEDFKQKLDAVRDKISVIIPCYNVEKYIGRCLDSILEQKITGAALEIICVDDKSSDGTLEILKEYENRYPELIMLIPLEENGRQGRARNIALQYASGKYITYVDADDMIMPNMLEILYKYAVMKGCSITECGYKEFSESQLNEIESAMCSEAGQSVEYRMNANDDSVSRDKFNVTLLDMAKEHDRKWYILNRGWKTGPWGRLYAREFLTANEIVFAEDIFMEDVYFSEQCMAHMDSYCLIGYEGYLYYQNTNGTMQGPNVLKYYMDVSKVQNMATDYILSSSLMNECMEELAYLHFSKVIESTMYLMLANEQFYSYENIMSIKRSILGFFPGILSNRYIEQRRKDPIVALCIEILRNDYTDKDLKYLIMG